MRAGLRSTQRSTLSSGSSLRPRPRKSIRSCSKSRISPAVSSRSHLIGRHEARDLLLRPVEPERFAEPGVGAGQRQLVELLARAERGDAEHAVELVQPDQPVGRSPCSAPSPIEPLAARRGFVADFGADQAWRRGRDLAPGRARAARTSSLDVRSRRPTRAGCRRCARGSPLRGELRTRSMRDASVTSARLDLGPTDLSRSSSRSATRKAATTCASDAPSSSVMSSGDARARAG